MKVKEPLDLITTVSSIAFIIQLFISYKLWVSVERFYPKVPLIAGVNFPYVLEQLLFSILILSLGIIAFFQLKKWVIPLIVLLWLSFFLQDVLSLQAWSYHYLLVLILVWLAKQWPSKKSHALELMRLLMVGTYFWTGFHKINLHFAEEVFPWLMSILPLTKALEEVSFLGYFLAIFELLLGLGLLWKRSRLWTVYLISVFHVLILVLLIADGWNYVVYTWNISMILMVWILFHPKMIEQKAFDWSLLKKWGLSYVFIFSFLIAPALQPFGLWPYDLSMMMYTGLSTELEIEITDQHIQTQKIWDCIPKSIAKEFYKTTSGYLLYTDDWTMTRLNVPSVSSISYQEEIAKQLCDCLGGGMEFKILTKKRWKKIADYEVEDCSFFE